MKAYDIYLIIKLVCLEQAKPDFCVSQISVRQLSAELGMSVSTIENALRRARATGLITRVSKSGKERINKQVLFEFLTKAIKYVFPAAPGKLITGVPTTFAAPALKGKIMTAGLNAQIWPYQGGDTSGYAIKPLHKAAPAAALQDERLHQYLALVDSVRVGRAREVNLASDMLRRLLLEPQST